MIDLKYHIASLVAVFLALGIGILIGTTMLGNDTLVEYQKQVTDRLENQLEQLREKNESIRATASELEMNLNIQKEFNQEILPVLVNNRLEGVNLAVVNTKGYNFSNGFKEALEMSGANISSVTSFLDISNAENCKELARQLGWKENDSNNDYKTFVIRKVAKTVVSEDIPVDSTSSQNTSNEGTTIIEKFSQSDIIQVTGNYNESIDGVILVGGSRDNENSRLNKLDIHLIEVFQDSGVPVYGVEEKSAGYSYMQFYQKQGLEATIDNIDTVPGQLALILAIDGEPGHYGVKSTSRQLLPELDTSRE